MKSVLIIGGNRFIGSNLADKFSQFNFKVKIFQNESSFS